MGKATRPKKVRRTIQKGRASPDRGVPGGGGTVARRLRAAADGLLHVQMTEPVWRYFGPVLALAFAARAAVALSGDFFMHPDEIMQYLEQGHRLVFGYGAMYWETFYGARSWLVPGLIAGVLKLFDVLGLGQPFWYVGGVKLTFCAISLLTPAGMYFFARRHFGEPTARVALLAGAFWYELVGFAHKPQPELIATALLTALLMLVVTPPASAGGSRDKLATVWLVAFLAVLSTAIRVQYAPVALVLLGLFFLRAGTGAKIQLAVAATVFFLAVGAFDAATWDAGPFHSYLNYFRFHAALPRFGESPVYQYAWWITLASGGLAALCAGMALRDVRRYGFLLGGGALILLIHSMAGHKEYRYVFIAVPCWLLLSSDIVTRLARRMTTSIWMYGPAAVLFMAVSLAGILNALPYQDEGLSANVSPPIRFIRDQSPIFAAYRYLAHAPGVKAIWQVDRDYASLPSYYYLHRKIPFYDNQTGRANHLWDDVATLQASVSHIVTYHPNLAAPGYATEKQFGVVRILRREENESPVRQWQEYIPTITHTFGQRLMHQVYPNAPPPPANFGIRFVESEPSTRQPRQ